MWSKLTWEKQADWRSEYCGYFGENLKRTTNKWTSAHGELLAIAQWMTVEVKLHYRTKNWQGETPCATSTKALLLLLLLLHIFGLNESLNRTSYFRWSWSMFVRLQARCQKSDSHLWSRKFFALKRFVVFGRFDSVISINCHHSRLVFPLRIFANKSSTCISW